MGSGPGACSRLVGPAPADADAYVSEPEKFDKYFSTNPGEGD